MAKKKANKEDGLFHNKCDECGKSIPKKDGHYTLEKPKRHYLCVSCRNKVEIKGQIIYTRPKS